MSAFCSAFNDAVTSWPCASLYVNDENSDFAVGWSPGLMSENPTLNMIWSASVALVLPGISAANKAFGALTVGPPGTCAVPWPLGPLLGGGVNPGPVVVF